MRYIYFQVYVRKLNSEKVVQMFPAFFFLPFANKLEPHTGETNELLNVDVVNMIGFYVKK